MEPGGWQKPFHRMQLDLHFTLGRYLFRIDVGSDLFNESEDIYAYRHSHTSYEVHYVLTGDYVINVSQEQLHIAPGHLLIIAPAVYHSIMPFPDGGERARRIGFNFSFARGPQADLHLTPDIESEALVDAFRFVDRYAVVKDDSGCLKRFEDIRHEFFEKRIGYYRKIQNGISDILVELARRLSPAHQDIRPPEKTPEDKQLEILDDFFDLNLRQNTAKSELARLLKVSMRQVDRVMQHRFQMSFRQKLLECRIEMAKDLLADTGLTIQKIAELTGYGFESSLHKVFRKIVGMTPQAYREKSREIGR